MSKKTQKDKKTLSDEPRGSLRRVVDFLPAPDELLPKEETVKITISVDTDTIDFFKQSARENGTKYQRMMREVLKGYAKKYG